MAELFRVLGMVVLILATVVVMGIVLASVLIWQARLTGSDQSSEREPDLVACPWHGVCTCGPAGCRTRPPRAPGAHPRRVA